MSVDRTAGFPDRLRFVPIPVPFFGTWLQQIDTLAELKVVLHVLRLLYEPQNARRHVADPASGDGPKPARSPRDPRYVRRSELLADRGLLLALRNDSPSSPESALEAALGQAVGRGILIAIGVQSNGRDDVCYLLNTLANRQTALEVERGARRLGPFAAAPPPAEVGGPDPDRPTIYDFYEQNIGLLTPLLAEELREADLTYPAAWIEDAFREAVGQNRRSWRYVQRVLDNWATRGRETSGETRRRPDPAEDPRAYRAGKYGQLIRR